MEPLRISKVAKLLNITESGVVRLIERGQIKVAERRATLIDAASVGALMLMRRIKTNKPEVENDDNA